jgi:hypothetical protein
MTPALFGFGYFSNKVSLYAQTGLDHDPPIYAFHVTGMTDVHYYIQVLLVEVRGSCELSAWAGIEE